MPSKSKKWSLKEFQTQFLDSFFNHGDHRPFLNTITPAGKLVDGAAAMRVYQKGYVFRLTEALGIKYESIQLFLGDQAFFSVCADYIRCHTANQDLSNYGRAFPEFLERTRYNSQHSFLPDLARLELAFFDTAQEPDHEPISPSKLAEIETSPFSILQFGPSVRFMTLHHSVYELWKTRTQPKLMSFDEPEYLALYKRDGFIYVETIKASDYHLLRALASGTSLGTYLNDDERAPTLNAEDISELFFFIASEGLIETIKPGPK